MPKSRVKALNAKFKDLDKLLVSGGTFAPEENEEPSNDDAFYPVGFGSRRGTFCHCSRCLRRSGPLTDDVSQVYEDILSLFEKEDSQGAENGETSVADESHRLLAETSSLAVERGDQGVLTAILDSLMDLDLQAELATRIAISIAQHGHVHLVPLLSQYDADLEVPDPIRGGPPLMHAANNGHASTVSALLEHGAYPDAKDYNDQTALMVAVFSDRANAAEALLEGGASVDAVDDKGRTALCHAARYGSMDCIAVLAAWHADVFHRDAEGRHPLEIAEDCSRLEAAVKIKSLQQRQRLRERKDSRQRGQESKSATISQLEMMHKEAEALKHALALVQEEESEAERRAAKKLKSKKPRKKNKASEAGTEAKPQNGSLSPKVQNCGQAGHAMQNGNSTAGDGPPSEPRAEESRLCHGAALGPDSKRVSSQQQTGSLAAEESQGGDAKGAEEEDPVHQLRADWDALLREAATCQDCAQQVQLVARVQGMAEKCAAAGISVKYGKKLLGKLEKVQPVREALEASLASTRPSMEALAAALDQARGLKSFLDERLLSEAEAELQSLELRASSMQAQAAQAEAVQSKEHRSSAGGRGFNQRSPEVRGPRAKPSPQLPPQPLLDSPAASGRPREAATFEGRPKANGFYGRSPRLEPEQSWGNPPRAAPGSRVSLAPLPLPRGGPGLPLSSGFRGVHHEAEPAAAPSFPSEFEALFPSASGEAAAPHLTPNIWQQQTPISGPEDASRFFRGSLFSLPLASGARPGAEREHQPGSGSQPASARTANSWKPASGGRESSTNWLGQLLAGNQEASGPSQPVAFHSDQGEMERNSAGQSRLEVAGA